jgi:hypothetical protein
LKVLGGGDMNARIQSVYTQNAKVDTDGSVLFTTTAPTLTLGIMGSKHGGIEVRAYDENAKARVEAGDGSTMTYEADGVVFASVSDNSTPTTVAADGDMQMTMDVKADNTASDFNDYGVYVMFDADNTYWDNIQQVKFDGAELSNVKTSLVGDEATKFSNYEFVFLIPQGKLIDGKNHQLYFDAHKSSGATGSDTLHVDFAVKSNFLSVDGYTVKTAAVKDSSSRPTVDTVFHTSFLSQ